VCHDVAADVVLELARNAETMTLHWSTCSDYDKWEAEREGVDDDDACEGLCLVKEALARSLQAMFESEYAPAEVVCVTAPPGVVSPPHRSSPTGCRRGAASVAHIDTVPAPPWLRAGALCRAWRCAAACSACARRVERFPCNDEAP
jgi:hypothetical protein